MGFTFLWCYVFYYTETENLIYIYIYHETVNYQCAKTTGPIFMKLRGLLKEGVESLHVHFEANLRIFDL